MLFIAQMSLLVSPEECQTLQLAKENYLIQQKRPLDPDSLYLSAIIYTDVEEWVAWINGEKWVASQPQADHFIIRSVTHDAVVLDIKGNRVTLRPNQCYSPKLKAVFDGDIRTHKPDS